VKRKKSSPRKLGSESSIHHKEDRILRKKWGNFIFQMKTLGRPLLIQKRKKGRFNSHSVPLEIDFDRMEKVPYVH
jgi:hypothetical protein